MRNLERSKWLAALFEQKYGKDCFQLVQVATLDEAEAVGRAMKGTSPRLQILRKLTPEQIVPL